MKTKLIYILTIISALLIAGCKGKEGKKFTFKPVSSGGADEVMVVLPEAMKNGVVAGQLNEILSADVPGLPQTEPNLTPSWVSTPHFDNFLKPVRNLLIIETSDIYTQPKLTYEKDKWATNQSVLYLRAPDAASISPFLEKNGQYISDFFVNAELNRVIGKLKDNYNRDAAEELSKQLGLEMKIPGELNLIKKGKDFFWISNGKNTDRMDIVVYSLPYTNKNMFTEAGINALRDSVMQANIPGGPEGSYMARQKYFDPLFRAFSLNGKYVAEMRGLWEIKGDVMGGPYVSHTRLDEANQRVITAEAFIYAPERNKPEIRKGKRNMMRQLEASLYTLKLPYDTELPEIVVSPAN